MDIDIIRKAWALLETVTPIKTDCGLYCGRACCKPDEDGQGGVLLFPGEEQLIGNPSWGRIERGDGGWILVCEGLCERGLRPLGCRIFPLTPVMRKGGAWGVKLDRRAWVMCPLMRSGVSGLDPGFREAVREAVEVIGEAAEGREFLAAWVQEEKAYGQF